MNKPKSYDLQDLKSKLDYNEVTGVFTWKTREGSCGPFNKLYAGKPAGGFSEGDSKGYIRIRYKGKLIKAHRLAWAFMTGEFPDTDIDHVDGDIQNNSWSNLRKVSRTENGRNQKRYSNNTSGVVGVYWSRSKSRYLAQIGSGKSRKHLGNYTDKFEAICARKSEEVRLNYHENHGRN